MVCDVYCALCGVAFSIKTITSSARTQAFKLHFTQHCRADEGRRDHNHDCQFCDGTYDCHDENGCGILHSYDSAVIEDSDTAWTQSFQILGINERVPGVRKAFLSGEGRHVDYGMVEVEIGDHKNQPLYQTTFPAYTAFKEDKAVYPFHSQCYEVLQRAGKEKIQLDMLYAVFARQSSHYCAFTSISYGNPGPTHRQFFPCVPGEEFMVVDPMKELGPDELIDPTAAQIQSYGWKFLELGEKVRNDPFDILPNEVLCEVVYYLPTDSIFAFAKASWAVNACLTSPKFWIDQINLRLPWFWELYDFVKANIRSPITLKQLFLWAEVAIRPRRWLTGPIMGIANRRRVWAACRQIIDLYNEDVHQSWHGFRDKSLCAVYDQAEVLQMPYIADFADQEDTQHLTSIWVNDQYEAERDTLRFETYWEQGSLVGISVSLSKQRLPLGRCVLDGIAVRAESCVLDAGDWIQGFVLHMQDPCPFDLDTYSCIEGIDVLAQSGKKFSLGSAGEEYTARCQRLLQVCEGRRLVGLSVEIARDRFSRLGLVECRFPLLEPSILDPNDPDSEVEQLQPPDVQQCLWRSTFDDDFGNKFWNSDRLNYTEIKEDGCPYGSTILDDLVPRHPLLFASKVDELKSVTKIWAISALVDFAKTSAQRNRKVWPLVAGMCVEILIEDDISVNYAGYDADVGPQSISTPSTDSSIEDEGRKQTQAFDIDGPGGEMVTEVAVCRRGEYIRSIRLRTNKDREMIFGDTEGPHYSWSSITAPEGETIIGISLAFGLEGWDPLLEYHLMKTHRLVSRVGVFTLKNT